MNKELDPRALIGSLIVVVVVIVAIAVHLFGQGQGSTAKHAGDGKILPSALRADGRSGPPSARPH